jgi:single-strand DNA-binding protein
VNRVCILGRLCKDPLVKETGGGSKVAEFTLAIDREMSKSAKENAKQTADFIRCTAWGVKADLIEKYVHKGDKLALCGKIQSSSYEDNDGKKIYTTFVNVDSVDFCGDSGGGKKESGSEGFENFSQLEDLCEKDLPF